MTEKKKKTEEPKPEPPKAPPGPTLASQRREDTGARGLRHLRRGGTGRLQRRAEVEPA